MSEVWRFCWKEVSGKCPASQVDHPPHEYQMIVEQNTETGEYRRRSRKEIDFQDESA